jgi:hypothetical protein
VDTPIEQTTQPTIAAEGSQLRNGVEIGDIYLPRDPAAVDVCALLSEASDRSGSSEEPFGGFREDAGFRVCPGTAADRLWIDPPPPAEIEGWEELQLGLLPTATTLEQARDLLESLDLGDETLVWESLPPSGDAFVWFSERAGYFAVAVSLDPYFFFVTDADPGRAIAIAEATVSVLDGVDVCGLLGAALSQADVLTSEAISGDSESAGFERCSGSGSGGGGFGNLNLGLMETVTSLDQAQLILEDLVLDGAPSEWKEAGEGIWTAEHGRFHVVAAWRDPYLFFVTYGNAGTAMAVADGVIAVLEAAAEQQSR